MSSKGLAGTRLQSRWPRCASASARPCVVRCSAAEDRATAAQRMGVLAASAAIAGMVAAPMGAFAVEEKVLAEKGQAFAEATAQVLRTVDGGAFKDALKAGVDVALSVDPAKALDSVDAVLEGLETADIKALQNAVKTAEHATTVATEKGVLIPPDEEIDAVVASLAKVGGSMNPAKVTAIGKKVTAAGLSADKGKLAGLTFAGGKIALSADKGALARATQAATDLLLAVSG
eukprot:evm.model.scf_608.8 EVM.evm.TU.scf_608.8   scf_608:51997-55732(-)